MSIVWKRGGMRTERRDARDNKERREMEKSIRKY